MLLCYQAIRLFCYYAIMLLCKSCLTFQDLIFSQPHISKRLSLCSKIGWERSQGNPLRRTISPGLQNFQVVKKNSRSLENKVSTSCLLACWLNNSNYLLGFTNIERRTLFILCLYLILVLPQFMLYCICIMVRGDPFHNQTLYSVTSNKLTKRRNQGILGLMTELRTRLTSRGIPSIGQVPAVDQEDNLFNLLSLPI